MIKLYWSSSVSDVQTALAALPQAGGIVVGAGWLDVLTPGELHRQQRRGRVAPVIVGARIYVSLQGNVQRVLDTLTLLATIDAARFAAAQRAFRERNPRPAVGHTVPRRPKHSKLVAHGWGSGPMGCARVSGLDSLAVVATIGSEPSYEP